jgi:hypothetical protein
MQKLHRVYQPFLLRLFHGLVGIFTLAAMTTGFWVYNVFDGRWGRINFAFVTDIQEIHGSFGILSFLAFPSFVVYAFRKGQKRLVQPYFLRTFVQFGCRGWWLNLHQAINTLIIIPLALALFSGQMMDGSWLPNRELDHFWYSLHILSWLFLSLCLILHILLSAKVGGTPLLLSIVNLRFSAKDSPAYWPYNIRRWFNSIRSATIMAWWNSAGFYQYMEVTLLSSMVLSLILSAFHES